MCLLFWCLQDFHSLQTHVLTGWSNFVIVQLEGIELSHIQPRKVQVAFDAWTVIALAERLFAGLLLVFASPVLLSAAVVIIFFSRQSPLVAHRRVGRRGCQIWLLKLRTMWNGQTSPDAPFFVERLKPSAPFCLVPKVARDPRVPNSFAAFCRRSSLDELPQLWHVLRGDMALVGPRPLTAGELEVFYGSDLAEVLTRKPGLSGLWQISGRSRLSYRQRRRLDLFLVRNWSFGLYLRILFATVPRVLTGKDAW